MKNENHTALLIMDVQQGIVQNLPGKESFFSSLKKAIATARKNDIPVIYVVVGFRKDYPEVSSANKMFTNITTSGRKMDEESSYKVAAEVTPQTGELVVTKKRVSAFTGSDLEVILRAKEIKHLVLTGVATSGVVLSTLREAADKDYRLTVLSDCCADRDEEVQHVLLTRVFPKQADVMSTEEWSREVAK
ncbi:MAG TPA: isochorismatase family cysteine hydrolase [Hanamia sp.]|nr:isochorismatase family cysteine hydrolase [Hanamia sp.]